MNELWARLLRRGLFVISMTISHTACLVPPDGSLESVISNHPPHILLDSIRPAKTVSEVSHPTNFGGDCPGILLRAEVFDPDGDALEVRFVTDNNIDNLGATIIDLKYPGVINASYPIQFTVLPAQHIYGIDIQDTHVISMFVTDAPEYKTRVEGNSNFAEIDADPDGDGIDDYALVEYRWTFQFVERGDLCPQ